LECNAHTFSHRSVGNRISTVLRLDGLGLVLRIAPLWLYPPAQMPVGFFLHHKMKNAAELEGLTAVVLE
jgi:hypothetical protein